MILYSKFRIITGLISFSLLAGCVTAKVDGYAPYSKFLAARDIISENCLAINPTDKDYINYRVAASKLLTVMNVDAQLYNHTYSTLYTNTRNEPKQETAMWCEKLRADMVNETYELEGDYQVALSTINANRREKAEKWANAIETIALTMLAVGAAYNASSAYQVPQYQYIPMSLPAPRIGNIDRSSANHYLVNTASGLRQCTIVSNYVRCS